MDVAVLAEQLDLVISGVFSNLNNSIGSSPCGFFDSIRLMCLVPTPGQAGHSSAAILWPALSTGISHGQSWALWVWPRGDTEQTVTLKYIFARNQIGMQLSVKRKRKWNIGSVEANSKITNLEFWPLSVIMWPKKKFLRIKNCGCNPCHR